MVRRKYVIGIGVCIRAEPGVVFRLEWAKCLLPDSGPHLSRSKSRPDCPVGSRADALGAIHSPPTALEKGRTEGGGKLGSLSMEVGAGQRQAGDWSWKEGDFHP